MTSPLVAAPWHCQGFAGEAGRARRQPRPGDNRGKVSIMSTTTQNQTTFLRGRFTGGVIVLDDMTLLPEGTAVTVIPQPQEMPAEMRQEFAAWDRVGAEAWKLIAEWEDEEGHGPETLA